MAHAEPRSVTIYVGITDRAALIQRAAEQMVREQAFASVEAYMAEYGEDEDAALRFLIDPGLTIPGVEVYDSAVEG